MMLRSIVLAAIAAGTALALPAQTGDRKETSSFPFPTPINRHSHNGARAPTTLHKPSPIVGHRPGPRLPGVGLTEGQGPHIVGPDSAVVFTEFPALSMPGPVVSGSVTLPVGHGPAVVTELGPVLVSLARRDTTLAAVFTTNTVDETASPSLPSSTSTSTVTPFPSPNLWDTIVARQWPTPTEEPAPTTTTATTTIFVPTHTTKVIYNPLVYISPTWSAAPHIPICEGQYHDPECSPVAKRAALGPATAASSNVAPPTHLPGHFPHRPFAIPKVPHIPIPTVSAWLIPASVQSPDAAAGLANPKLDPHGTSPPTPTGTEVPGTLQSQEPTVEQRWLDNDLTVDDCIPNPWALHCIARPGSPPPPRIAIEQQRDDDVRCMKDSHDSLDCSGRPLLTGPPALETTPTDFNTVEQREVAGAPPGKPLAPGSYPPSLPTPPPGWHADRKPDDPRLDDPRLDDSFSVDDLPTGMPPRPTGPPPPPPAALAKKAIAAKCESEDPANCAEQ
ncbi:MAG: hypothetical protein LQ346_002303 [Caloplaca aetnensis]|nr:MAG: hypothetical protein LQ346_002303 [Caloplaca aetnensis]